MLSLPVFLHSPWRGSDPLFQFAVKSAFICVHLWFQSSSLLAVLCALCVFGRGFLANREISGFRVR